MKRLYKSSVLLGFLLLFASPVFPQMYIGKEIVPLAPDVWSFMKYGGQSAPDLYTETLHLSIPLYTYKDQDFEIPISMDYTTNGFMPNKTTGVVGLGWNLNVGGCITRTVRQYADEDNSGQVAGCFHYSPENVMRNPFTYKEGTQMARDERTWCYKVTNDKGYTFYVESEPDIYTFRFNGHAGKFLLTKPGGQYKAWLYDISGPGGEYKIQVRDANNGFNFTIITGDGYKYDFDHLKNLDYYSKMESFYQAGDLSNRNDYGETYITWLLTAIEAPNGRKVEFDYEVCQNATCVQPVVTVYCETLEYSNSADLLTDIEKHYTSGSTTSYIENSTNYAILSKISVDNGKFQLTAHHSKRKRPERHKKNDQDSGTALTTMPMQKLDSLLIRSDSGKNRLKKITFGYKSMPTTSNPILFLKDIRVSGEGAYTMTYNSEDSIFPCQGTSSMDHWGYLNDETGNYNIRSLIPALKIDDSTGLQTIIKERSKREPNFNAAVKGTLSRITYPTGGYTCFEYEPHQCSHQLVRDLTNPTYVIKTANDEAVGGVRIREIIDNPQSSEPRRKTYTYETAGRSSGILMRSPMYYQSFGYGATPNGHYGYATKSSETLYPYTLDASHICYSDVTETLSNGAVTKYHFSSYLDPECTDLFVSETEEEILQINGVTIDVHHLYTEADSRYVLRGKLLRKEYFESGKSEPWSVERYKYVNRNLDSIPGQKVRYYACLKNALSAIYVSKTYLDNCLLDEWSCTYFDGADSTMLHKKYTYNRLNQEISVRTTDYGLRTSTLSEKLFLADMDIDTTNSLDPHKKMLDCNIVCYPIKTLTAFHKSLKPRRIEYFLTDGAYYEFGINNNMVCLNSLWKTRTPRVDSIFGGFEFDDLLFTERSYSYNNLNYPIEIRNRANRPTTILWGYGGLYPVAVIKNWSIADCVEVIKKDIFTQPFTAGIDEQYRQHILEQPNIEATFYTYQPYVGITSICDPSERFTYYDYDPSGRLKLILDDRGARMKAYKYNIQNQ